MGASWDKEGIMKSVAIDLRLTQSKLRGLNTNQLQLDFASKEPIHEPHYSPLLMSRFVCA